MKYRVVITHKQTVTFDAGDLPESFVKIMASQLVHFDDAFNGLGVADIATTDDWDIEDLTVEQVTSKAKSRP